LPETVGNGTLYRFGGQFLDESKMFGSTGGFSSEADASRGRVLLADDDRLTCEFIAEILRRNGHDVEIVSDGEAAIERAGRGGLDLALLDVLMPRINGLEACRIVKSLPGAGSLPVVLLTMRTDTSARIEGLRVGADDYICKPIDERELLSRVNAMLRMKRLGDQVAAAKARLEELSTHDEMTGLYNFRHLNTRLGDEFKRSERYHDPLSCLLIDIDGLKAWNESHGRAVGDAIVRDTARAIRAALREIDVVARYGGDEFLVILPSTHFAGALAAADRVWRDVRALSWTVEKSLRASRAGGGSSPPTARITLSIGVALFPSRDVRSKDQLLRAAEASLLRSKRDGGDRICVFQHQGYIYSPNVAGGQPPATPAPKPPSNSGIVAARRVDLPQPSEKVPSNVTSIEGRRNRGE
jgi:two-component system, cell cycle response regulator